MGMFDLRCAVSGLSTRWTRSEEHGAESTCSQVLIEEVDGLWLPFTPPVSGVYDHYGRIELWERMVSDHNTQVCERLDALRKSGRLVLKDPEDFKKKTAAGAAESRVTQPSDERRVIDQARGKDAPISRAPSGSWAVGWGVSSAAMSSCSSPPLLLLLAP